MSFNRASFLSKPLQNKHQLASFAQAPCPVLKWGARMGVAVFTLRQAWWASTPILQDLAYAKKDGHTRAILGLIPHPPLAIAGLRV